MEITFARHIYRLVWLLGCLVSLHTCGWAASTVHPQPMDALDSMFVSGKAAIDREDFDEAMRIFTVICSHDDGSSRRRFFSMAYQRRGNIFYNRESYAEAMHDYLQARGIAERNGLPDRLPYIYANIGNVFCSTEDLESGIMFYCKALGAVTAKAGSDMLPALYNNLFYAYYLKENSDSVKKYFNLFKEVNPSDTRSRYDLLLNQGLLYDMEGESARAVRMFHRAAAFARESGLSGECEAAANSYIARTYERQQRIDSAMYYLRVNETMARKQNFNNLLVESLRDMARIYDRMGLKTEALQCKSEYLSISDSLFSHETLNMIKNSQSLYEQNSDAYTIRSLNNANALQRYWIIALFAVLTIIVLLSLTLWRQKRKLTTAYIDLYERNVKLLEAETRYAERIGSLEHKVSELEEAAPLLGDTEEAAERKSLIPKEQRQLLLEKIYKVAEHPDFYCDPDCSIDRLAAAIDSNARYVSEVINKEYGMNFRGFVNKYRVKEAMRRLEDNENYGHLTIKAVAESVGYKSQATFISVFTKETGLKPSLYQQLARRHQGAQ